MASVNKVILIGNLGRDPETRMTADGRPICSLALATTRRYKDSQGALQEETEWHRVTLFGRQAEVAQQYLKKGNPVYIEGRIRTNRYTDKDGIERDLKRVYEIFPRIRHLILIRQKPPAQTARRLFHTV